MIGRLTTDHSKWVELLPFVQFAFNCTPSRATRYTPNYLTFARELNGAIAMILKNPTNNEPSDTPVSDYVQKVADNMRIATKLAASTLQAVTAQSKSYYDQRVRPKQFLENDTVLVYSPRRLKGKFYKWQRLYQLEATMVKQLNDVTFLCRNSKSGENFITHIDKLRLLNRPAVIQNVAENADLATNNVE